MGIYTIEQATNRAWETGEHGFVFRTDFEPVEELDISEGFQYLLGGPPMPNYRYFKFGDRRFCWTSAPLDERWFRPFKWMVWTDRVVDDGDYYTAERDVDSIRFTDLRREAKEEALARLHAAKSEEVL